MGDGQRAGQQILGERKLAQAGELTLTKATGFGTFWAATIWKQLYMQERDQVKSFCERENRQTRSAPLRD